MLLVKQKYKLSLKGDEIENGNPTQPFKNTNFVFILKVKLERVWACVSTGLYEWKSL